MLRNLKFGPGLMNNRRFLRTTSVRRAAGIAVLLHWCLPVVRILHCALIYKKFDLSSSFLSYGFDFSNGNRYSPPGPTVLQFAAIVTSEGFHLNVSKAIWVLSNNWMNADVC